MRVEIYKDELYPYYGIVSAAQDGGEYDEYVIPDATYYEWQIILTEFRAMQAELAKLIGEETCS